MKTVINALQYKPDSSGIGVMIRELFGAYADVTKRPCTVILSGDSPGFPAGKNTEIIRSPWSHGQSVRRMIFQTFLMGRKYCREAVLLTNDSGTPFFLPGTCRLVPVITDLAVYRLPEVYQQSRVIWWRMRYRYVRRRAGLFIAISEFTKQEIIEILNISEERVRVVPMACPESLRRVDDPAVLAAMRRKYGLAERYILFVGNSNPRKNLKRMIRAFDLLKEQSRIPHQLVIAGGQGWKFDRAKAMDGVAHQKDVKFIGFVPDADMPALYSAASLFAFPTLYEGFGLPVLEAQACGVPVLTSNRSALPETGGSGALYIDPYHVADICSGMRGILENASLSEQLVSQGYKNLERFSWKESAKRLDEIVTRLCRSEGE